MLKRTREFVRRCVARPRFELAALQGARNLHLGCGNKPLKDFLNVDYYNTRHADARVDLNGPLPFADGEFDLVFSDNVFEHIEKLLELIRECHRVLRPGGRLVIRVPYYRSRNAFVDPTHLHFFTLTSMDYHVRGKFNHEQYRFFDEAFSALAVHFDPEDRSLRMRLTEAAGVAWIDPYECSAFSLIFYPHNLIYVLTK